jgi:hypothetical protein
LTSTKFESIVREQKGFMRIGKIQSKHLVPLIGKKVTITAQETKE